MVGWKSPTRCGTFLHILRIWRGSIFKGVWRNLVIYSCIYAVISLTYRLLITRDEAMKQKFELICIFCEKYQNLFPLQFILGFYVTQVNVMVF